MLKIAGLASLILVFDLVTKGLAVVLTPEPVAYYPLNDEYRAREIEGLTSDGNYSGRVNLRPGPHGNPTGSYEISNDNYIDVENQPNGVLDVKHSITVMAWVYPSTSYHSFHVIGYWNGRPGYTLNLYYNATAKRLEWMPHLRNDGGLSSVSEDFVPSNLTWSHFVASYNNVTGRAQLFVNGDVLKTSSLSLSFPLLTQYDLQFGHGLDGRIAQVRVYDEALSEEKVKFVYRCPGLDFPTKLNCGTNGSGITVTINSVPDLDQWTGEEAEWRLNNANHGDCQPTFGFCSVEYGPLNGSNCASLTRDSKHFIYSFQIRPQKEGSTPTRAYDHDYQVTCKYGRNGTVQSSILPIHELEGSTSETNDLEFDMELYSDENHKNIITDTVYLGEMIYVRTSVIHAFQEDLDLLLKECYTSRDSGGNIGRFTLIRNSCDTSNDPTVSYNCSIQTDETEDFGFQAHRFPSQSDDDRVWVHCAVYACLADNPSSMCQTQCGDCSSRKRRDVGQLTDDPWYELSPSGPYRFVDREQGEDKGSAGETKHKSSVSTNDVLIITLSVSGVVAIAIVCVFLFAVLRKRGQNLTITETLATEMSLENAGCEIRDTQIHDSRL